VLIAAIPEELGCFDGKKAKDRNGELRVDGGNKDKLQSSGEKK
jgi:hypothetical protein